MRGQSFRRPPCWADRAWRLAYLCAYRVLRLWWRLRRPRHRGALVALWHDGKVLLVRSSYRRRWDLPGGGVRRGEDPAAAALRELKEEVGIELPEAALRLAYDAEIFWESRHDRVMIFAHEAAGLPALRLDNREIVEAAFRDPAAVDPASASPHLVRYLRERS